MNSLLNNLRLLNLSGQSKGSDHLCLAEVGVSDFQQYFGLVVLWLAKADPAAKLHYVIFDQRPNSNSKSQTAKLAKPQTVSDDLWDEWLVQHPKNLPGWQQFSLLKGRVQISVYFGDLLQGVTDLDIKVDRWLLWPKNESDKKLFATSGFISQLARQSQSRAQLVSMYQQADSIRNYEKWGFQVLSNQANSGLLIQKNSERRFASKMPWFDRPPAFKEPGHVIVVGAGLAGASVAYELAQVGWVVTVLEAKNKAADGASGNLAGALHPLVTADWNLRSQWYWQGLQATLARVKPWLANKKIQGQLNGLLHLAVDDKNFQRMQDALERVVLPADFAYWVEADQASDLLGGAVSQAGLFFPQAGWLNPPSVVAACLDHPKIEVVYEQSVQSVAQGIDWTVQTQNQIWRADALVLAEGALPGLLDSLPIRPLKGQVTNLNSNHQAWRLKRAVSHLGYSSPAPDNKAVTGATFEAPSLDPTVSMQGHQLNLNTVKNSLPDWLDVDSETLTGRVGFRPTTPDHLPIIGGVADQDWLNSAYLSQSHTQAIFKYPAQQYQRGLYVSNGHGARGLMSVFLAAKIICADMMGETMPVVPSLYAATHPARFKIRDWRRHGPLD
ncbi:FAD-dependent 5-carboxymethylaminomethyl-2-thiouridine(34) oxidoreductase MnmC [Thiomicrospira sp.]|uniref:FAD-dependent 5-carboxymethylaminomethyl-2-thiouridine(34) oxidoreductase MnmC n=1 Tax=Thiomicrospira sp. TaxID=935 RepID=UPI002F924433